MNTPTEIQQLLPQKAPFLLIDQLLETDENSAVSALLVREDTPFVENGKLQLSGLVENMAQTCAAYIGCRQYPKVEIGVIGAIPLLETNRLPSVGDLITTTIRIESEAWGMSAISATMQVEQQPIATGKMKIALTGQTLER